MNPDQTLQHRLVEWLLSRRQPSMSSTELARAVQQLIHGIRLAELTPDQRAEGLAALATSFDS